MANKRNLKKEIRYACGEVAFHTIITRQYVEGANIELLDQIIIRVAQLQAKSLANATFSFDKIPSDFDSLAEYNKAANKYYKQAYKSLKLEFNKQLQEIVNSLNKAIPAECRKKAYK